MLARDGRDLVSLFLEFHRFLLLTSRMIPKLKILSKWWCKRFDIVVAHALRPHYKYAYDALRRLLLQPDRLPVAYALR